MIGVIMFVMFYYLFDSLGIEFIVVLFIVIGVLFIIGCLFYEMVLKFLLFLVNFLIMELKEGW